MEQTRRTYTRKDLAELRPEIPEETIYKQVKENWDCISKPLDSLGVFETLTAQIGAASGTAELDLSKKAVIIMCADNGIVEEGVSQSGQEVTAAVAKGMAGKKTSVGKMAALSGVDTIPVDIGINRKEAIEGLVQKKIRTGTANFRKEPAMTEEEAVQAVFTGIEMVYSCKAQGYRMLATGEMGIGNTTTSSAVAAALLNCEVCEVTGRGAGLSDAGLSRKQKVIAEAIEKYGLRKADALRVLAAVGGLDIAGLAGVCIGGALCRIPVVLDGVISLTAALAAEEIVPGTKAYLIASHKGKEPAAGKIVNRLGLHPVIDAGLALGEGTGAVMMMSLLDMALTVYHNRTTFADAEIEQYKRFT